MIFCTYKVINLDGKQLEGKCWCTNRENLAKTFREKGYYLILYKENNNSRWSFFKRKLSAKDISILCSQISSLLEAGVNISDIIGIIKEEASNKVLKKCLFNIEHMLHQGMQLSSCMSTCLDIFPKFMVNMIKVGEESGNLGTIFDMLSKYYIDENTLKNKVSKAMLYPCTILVVSIFIVQLLLVYIIPVFVSTINELGGSIPVTTRIIIDISYFMRNNVTIIIALICACTLTVVNLIKLDNVIMLFHKFIIKNCFTKSITQKLISVNFSRTLGILIRSGNQIVNALEITTSILNNKYVKYEFKNCIEEIKNGCTISNSIGKLNLFPTMLCSMIRIGEESGTLDDILVKSSKIMEDELYNSLERLTSLIEPVLIIFLSIFIGFVLINLLIPMFNIMDTI
jgi:type IV pilus assembly protein PilC